MKIVVIGAGFSGISCVNKLCRHGYNSSITLIDAKNTSDFLPLLPDCIGRKIKPEYLGFDIKSFASRRKINFLNEEVITLSLSGNKVVTSSKGINYDYLVIASGSETNFYSNDNIKNNVFKLDGIKDIEKIRKALTGDAFSNYIIAGGGYTGVEIATNLAIFLQKNNRQSKTTILERAPDILGVLPEWMRRYVRNNLDRLGVNIINNVSINKIDSSFVYLSNGEVFSNALVIWAAGVKTADFIQDMQVEKNSQGRIKTDIFLRVSENCFAVGDVAYFMYKNIYLRMSVQFAITQGETAAVNIIRSAKKKDLIKYKPLDLGYIIPMANSISCGRVMGLNLKGFLPTILHFLMCMYRSSGLRNKLGVLKGL